MREGGNPTNENEVTACQGSCNMQHRYWDNKHVAKRQNAVKQRSGSDTAQKSFPIYLSWEGAEMEWHVASIELLSAYISPCVCV